MHVLISGAGIAGLTLAYALQRRGIESTVIEKSPSLRTEGYMVDFFGSGYDAAEKLGLLPDLEEIHYGIARLSFLDGTGREKYSLAYPDVRKLFDGRHFNFMRGDLERVLHSKLGDRAEVRFGVEIDAVEQTDAGCVAALSDGSSIRASIVVGADGIHSKVRALCFGPEPRFLRYLNLNTAAFIIDHPSEPLPDLNAFSTVTTPGRQVGVYPIRGGRLATFFIYSSRTLPQHLSQSTARTELRNAYQGMNWIVPELLRRMEESSIYFDSVSQIAMPAWSNGRIGLVGDAAYCVSLIAGQGASLAVAGGLILAEELSNAGDDIQGALLRYERRLRPAIEKKQAAGQSMAKWFVPTNSLRLAVRDVFMRLMTLGLIRRLLKRFLATESVFSNADSYQTIGSP
jgi:2-polyprenyl-6-methoxyphenol hydroxylase-like FAD-dependent oxidoreductase